MNRELIHHPVEICQMNSTMSTLSENSNEIPNKSSFPLKLLNEEKNDNFQTCYQCPIQDCVMLFRNEEELIKHKAEHNNLIFCQYPNCNKYFANKINFKKHCKYHFPPQKLYFCPYPGCKKGFSKSYNLTVHYRKHSGNNPYICQKCGKGYCYRANYQYHINFQHKEYKDKERICQHIGCERKSKTIKLKLIHHDKLEPECKNEKRLLLSLVLNFKDAITSLLDNCNIYNTEMKIEKKYKIEVDNIRKQSEKLFSVNINKNEYRRIIIGNY